MFLGLGKIWCFCCGVMCVIMLGCSLNVLLFVISVVELESGM